MDSEKLLELTKISKDKRVLYVEDDENARRSMLIVLENIFDNITVSVDGLDALNTFKEATFDLVITDINMPRMNGIEMIEGIRNIDESVPILILSSLNEVSVFTKTIKLGIDGYLLKPIDMQQLIEVLLKTVKNICMLNENEEYKSSLEEKVKERTKQLIHQSTHDQLTNKKNQVALENDISNSPKGALFLINIDTLKNYNELYGMDVGSHILKSFAEFLDNFFNDDPYELYRVYGDTFALYMPKQNLKSADCLDDLIKLNSGVKDFSVFIPSLDESLDIDATVALVVGEDQALEKCEMAMHYAKENRKQYSVYDTKVHSLENVQKELYWRAEIKEAIRNDNIIPVFQPIVNRDKQVKKHEALMRLVKDENGEKEYKSPFFFLETSKKTKQYRLLTNIMIDKSFKIMKENGGDFSINLSFEDIKDSAFGLMLEGYINKYDLGSKVIFEIVESEYIQDFNLVKNFVSIFRKKGVRIAIDDFGSGYSNFSHILELRPEFIKIDGSLIQNILTDHDTFVLVEAIINFSKKLNIKIIAEFVSSKEIYEKLFELGVDEFQGYYFSQPLIEPEQKDTVY